MPKFTIITPTVDVPVKSGRCPSYLIDALKSAINGGFDDFELLVGCDGDVPSIKESIDGLGDSRIKYTPFEFTGNFGNTQRNRLRKEAKGDYILYLDHDDAFIKGALKRIDDETNLFPGKLLVFQVVNLYGTITWKNRYEVMPTMISGQMMICPNNDLIPGWLPEDYYSADWNFCVQLLENYHRQGGEVVWIPEVIQQLRPWARSLEDTYAAEFGRFLKETLKR